MGLTVEDIIVRCQGALAEHTPALAVRDVLDELVSDPAALEQAVGPVELGGITALYNAGDLTITAKKNLTLKAAGGLTTIAMDAKQVNVT